MINTNPLKKNNFHQNRIAIMAMQWIPRTVHGRLLSPDDDNDDEYDCNSDDDDDDDDDDDGDDAEDNI